MKREKPRAIINRRLKSTLPKAANDPKAAREFLEQLYIYEDIFYINDDTLEMIKEYSDKGNGYAEFAYARYHACTSPAEDSQNIAMEYYKKAYANGIADAGIGMALATYYGRGCQPNRERYKELIEEAQAAGSRFATYLTVRETLYGWRKRPINPGKALTTINRFIQQDGEESIVWNSLKAKAIETIYGLSAATPYFEKVAEKGSISGWDRLFIARSYHDDLERYDKEIFNKEIKKAMDMESGLAYFLKAELNEYNKESVPLLEKAFKLGDDGAACRIGDLYFYHLEKDENPFRKAQEYYLKGFKYDNSLCAEKLVEMWEKGYAELDESTLENIIIVGARMDSERLIVKAVERYREGGMEQYAQEIEKYFVPDYDNLKDTEFEEYFPDMPDDDGRNDAYA